MPSKLTLLLAASAAAVVSTNACGFSRGYGYGGYGYGNYGYGLNYSPWLTSSYYLTSPMYGYGYANTCPLATPYLGWGLGGFRLFDEDDSEAAIDDEDCSCDDDVDEDCSCDDECDSLTEECSEDQSLENDNNTVTTMQYKGAAKGMAKGFSKGYAKGGKGYAKGMAKGLAKGHQGFAKGYAKGMSKGFAQAPVQQQQQLAQRPIVQSQAQHTPQIQSQAQAAPIQSQIQVQDQALAQGTEQQL